MLEKKIGMRFRSRILLKRALTHRSYANEKKLKASLHNERFEFLGDAVLELIVSHFLMSLYPEATEGELSKLRASMVNEKTLSMLARKMDIGTHLFLGKGEDLGKGRDKSSLLANAYEAILGAIYLDRGFKRAFKVIEKHAKELLHLIHHEQFYKDYKTQLQETSQTLFKAIPRYHLVEEQGPDHSKTFKVNLFIHNEIYGVGMGKSKKDAEQSAAREALEKIDQKNPLPLEAAL